MIVIDLRLVLDETRLPDGYQTEELAREYLARMLYERDDLEVGVVGAVPLIYGLTGSLVPEMTEHQYESDAAVLDALRTGRI